MQLTVLLYASYADAFGSDRLTIELPADAAVADLVAELRSGAVPLPPRPMVAVNRRHAPYTQRLLAGDEVAVIPPVAGG